MGGIEYKDWTNIPVEKIYKNKQIEREEVLKPCIKLCKKLEIQGYVIEWKRLDALNSNHIEGSPDLELKIPKDDLIWLILAECKKIGGVLSLSQIRYRDKYKPFRNVIYTVITNPDQLEKLVKEDLREPAMRRMVKA